MKRASMAAPSALSQVVALTRASHPTADVQPVRAAYDVAARWHAGQRRKSGEPYLSHPVAVALIVAGLGLSPRAVCVALLHDVLEDTDYPLERLRRDFGDDVARLVVATSMTADQVRAIKEQLRSNSAPLTSEQAEALAVKVADRLHNMRTLRWLAPARQTEKARQTRELVVPVARHLGLVEVEYELAALSDRMLRPHFVADRTTQASVRLLDLSVGLLPQPVQARWREEWAAEVATLPTRRARVWFCARTMLGVPQLARTVRDSPLWAVNLARIARILGIGSAIVAVTAPGAVAVWVAGGIAMGALILLTALLFAPNDAPTRRLANLISAWRHPTTARRRKVRGN